MDGARLRSTVMPVAALALAAGVTAVCVGRSLTVVGADAQSGLDSAAATIGTLLSYVLLGRFREDRRLRDLCLCAFLLLLGMSNALFSAIPHSVGHAGSPAASAVAAVVAGALFVAAAWLPDWQWRASMRAAGVALTGAVVLALSLSATFALGGEGIGSADTFGTSGNDGLTIAQLLAAGLFAIGAYGAVQAATQDTLMAWLCCAALIAAGSRIDFAIADHVGDAWATAGSALRVAFYLALLMASAQEIRGYWRRVAEVAVLEERRRIARDLHDGLAQELAFAATQSRALAERSEHPKRAQLIAAAAERALDESRRAIAALTRPLDEALEVALAQCAEEVCDRFDKSLVLDVQPGVRTSSDKREALLRIVREAVSNAARHSGAEEVRVRLRQGEQLELRVEDDGRGFDVDDLGHLSGRFGLVSMQERVQALDGTFTVVSRLRGGTAIEVTLP
jgi:signal transduction histidine kinase